MIESIKSRLFHQHFSKIKQVERSFSASRINTLGSITLLVDGTAHSVEELQAAIVYFRSKGIECDAFWVTAEPVETVISDISIISKKDCHWYEVPRQEVVISWLQHKTELLIVINPTDLRIIKYLSATSNSLLRAAVSYDDIWDETFDFSVEIKSIKDKSVLGLSTTLYRELLKIHQVEQV